MATIVGKVRFYNNATAGKEYGFIDDEAGTEYHFSKGDLKRGYDDPKGGDIVHFVEGKGSKGPKAHEVELAPSGTAFNPTQKPADSKGEAPAAKPDTKQKPAELELTIVGSSYPDADGWFEYLFRAMRGGKATKTKIIITAMFAVKDLRVKKATAQGDWIDADIATPIEVATAGLRLKFKFNSEQASFKVSAGLKTQELVLVK